MPRIRCLYMDCNFLDASYCTASNIEIDPDLGCATYAPIGEDDVISADWETEDDEFESWDTEDLDIEDDEDDIPDDEEDDWLDD